MEHTTETAVACSVTRETRSSERRSFVTRARSRQTSVIRAALRDVASAPPIRILADPKRHSART